MIDKKNYISWFREVDSKNAKLVGQKAAGLAEMMEVGISIPNGFCIASAAYFQFLKNANLILKIKGLLQGVDSRDPRSLSACSQEIKRLIFSSKVPEEIGQQIMKNYLKLGGFFKEALVAVRSSPLDEKLKMTSFLNMKGEANVVEAVKKCWASLFDPENLLKNKDLLEEKTIVLIQRMIQSRVSGVMFSTNPNNKKEIIVKAIYGLGELAVDGKVSPDEYIINKDTFEILDKAVNSQPVRLIKSGTSNKQTKVPTSKQGLQKLTDREIINLAKLAKKIQRHYFFPQEIEFAIEKRKIYILETEPIGIRPKTKNQKLKTKRKISNLKVLIRGKSASSGIVSGYARVIKDFKKINQIKKDEILISSSVNADFLSTIKKISGLVMEEKDSLSYGAMISRELGLPCVIDAKKAAKIIKTGMVITINGKTGAIFKGGWQIKNAGKKIKYKPKMPNVKDKQLPTTATKAYINLNGSQIIKQINEKIIDGILFQPEFLVAQTGIHPKKLINDKKERKLVEKLSKELNKICQEFNPKPVIYKVLNFKTDEYQTLVGGKAYESKEANPLLGFHGAARYVDDSKVFELQLEMIKKIRKGGSKNLSLMIPFVRTTRELKEIKKIIASHHLIRSPSFKLWIRLEIPSNIFLLEDFITTGIDGICLELQKLMNLTFAIDEENQELFSKMAKTDFFKKEIFEKILKTTKKHRLSTLVSLQENFLYSDLLGNFIKSGISGFCVAPDAVLRTKELIYESEKRIVR
ncbi:phosphoenolpyruvate synthase [Candidatus Microgenomates bacterium]|nr:phosphoenolpyruvate synthase [Candidatus Microgenomates bacterium]